MNNMKKITAFILAVIMLLSCMPSVCLAADNSCGEALTWSFDEASATLVIEGKGSMTSWYTHRKVPWKSIREKVEHLSLPEGLTTIGDYAFFGFKNLREVSFPVSLTSIGNGSFGACASLREAIFQRNMKDLGGWVFAGCTSLEKVTFPSGMKTINYECFLNCPSLMDVTIPAGVSISNFAFGYGKSHCYYYDMVIRGKPGSSAESYAKQNLLNFVSLSSMQTIPSSEMRSLLSGIPDASRLTDYDIDADGQMTIKDVIISKRANRI